MIWLVFLLHKRTKSLGIGRQAVLNDLKGSKLIGVKRIFRYNGLDLFAVRRPAEDKLTVFERLAPRADKMSAVDKTVYENRVPGIILFDREMWLDIL